MQGPVAAISLENLLFGEALPHAESEHTGLLLLLQEPPENLQVLFVSIAPVGKWESTRVEWENGSRMERKREL